MELKTESVVIESSGILQEDSFGISDMGFILHLLRNKIYANIKKAICQEITSNARDAHREVGKNSTPIEISLPTWLDPNYRVRDFGPGISPDRMKNVFIKYAASTKRADNTQTGGFGLGAKTPFGYSDSFIINTYINGIHRSYSAVIDDTRCGKLVLMSESKTKEETGTEIVIPIQPRDFDEFKRETHRACKHWDVKPIIKGGEILFNDFTADKIILEGSEWFITKNGRGDRETRLIVDGIEYPFNLEWLPEKIIPNFGYSTTLYLKFPVGVVSLSANREQVELDDNTKTVVTARLKIVKAELRKRFEDAVKNSKTFLEANVSLHKIHSALNIEMPDDLLWNGVKLYGKHIRLDHGQATVYDRSTKNDSKGNTIVWAKRYNRHASSTFDLNEETVFCLTSVENVSDRGAAAVLKSFPQAKSVTMLRFFEPKEIQEKNIHLLNPVQLTAYYSPRNKVSAGLGRLIFYKFDATYNSWSRSSVDTFEKDPNQKVWCFLTKKGYGRDQRAEGMINNHFVPSETIANFLQVGLKGYSLYGFMQEIPEDKIEEATEGMEKLDEIVKSHIANATMDIGEVIFACNVNSNKIGYLFDSEEHETLIKNIANFRNQNTAIIHYLNEYKTFTDRITELQKYRYLMDLTKGQFQSKKIENKIGEMGAAVLRLYPLLKMMAYDYDKYGYSHRECRHPDVEQIIHYINVVDKADEI